MPGTITRWLSDRSGSMVESAITMPILILLSLAFVNLALAGYASATAQNAANYGARMGALSFSGAAGHALDNAREAASSGIGSYDISVAASDTPGSTVAVTVRWQVPNFFAGLMPLFGQSAGDLKGTASASYRKEGW